MRSLHSGCSASVKKRRAVKSSQRRPSALSQALYPFMPVRAMPRTKYF